MSFTERSHALWAWVWRSGLGKRSREVEMAENNNAEQTSIEISHFAKRFVYNMKEQIFQVSSVSIEDNDALLVLASTIFKVPQKLRQCNDNAFEPNIVSIGPIHHGKAELAPMEKIKLQYLNSLLNRFAIETGALPEEIFEQFVRSIKEVQKYARHYYAEPIKLEDNKFIEIMVVDGCFLLELFRKEAMNVSSDEDELIFNTWVRQNLYHDLILLENQIPWFILKRLFLLTVSAFEQENHFLEMLVIKYFETMMLTTVPINGSPRNHEIKHILDLLHNCLLSSSGDIMQECTDSERLPPITDLLEAGIKFESGTPGNIFNIKFDNGVFKIPPISIQRNSESLFQNLIAYEHLIAYEQCDTNSTCRLITSHAVFLDSLINTNKEVDILYDARILRIHPSITHEDTVRLFNRLYNDTHVCPIYYGEVYKNVYKYYVSSWPRWRASFKRDYLNSPWAVSSITAAFFLLAFTFTQTLLAILSYVS